MWNPGPSADAQYSDWFSQGGWGDGDLAARGGLLDTEGAVTVIHGASDITGRPL